MSSNLTEHTGRSGRIWAMLPEREQSVDLLRGKLRRLLIGGFLFDLDDTILDTTTYITEFKVAFCVWAAEKLGMKVEEVRAVFEMAVHDTYSTMYVSQERWETIARITAKKLTKDKYYLDDGIEILMRIFDGSPKLFKGAEKAIKLLHDTGGKMGIVTHAPKNGWTEIKMRETGLEQYFNGVWIADDREPKGMKDWLNGANMIGVPCRRIMGWGDSPDGDIKWMLKLNFGWAFALEQRWVGATGKLPKKVRLLSSLTEAPEAILALQQEI